MKCLHLKKILMTLIVSLYLISSFSFAFAASKEKCRTCSDIVDHFKEGLEKTKKSNFGGGNTKWEEKSLGRWAHSETRLVEIWDNYLCKGDSKECHMLLERHEEDVEEFWFKVHAKNEDADMKQWFCIDRIKVCCPSNTYGPNCEECTGGKGRPCTGNGDCDGEGTREGSGKCRCHAGYRGDLCDECTDNYFEESKNDTHTVCKACHESCKSTCWEAGPKGCDECKSGWTQSETDGCVDVDECLNTPCDENQYCTNTPGKYNCATCHRACADCTGYGADKCEACTEGYRDTNGFCSDINECVEDKSLCSGEKQSCQNTEGSYECLCEDDLVYNREAQKCFPKPKEPPKTKKTKEKRVKEKTEQGKPGLLILVCMVVVFYVCCSIVRWNLIVVFCLSIVLATFLYWFGAQHDVIQS